MQEDFKTVEPSPGYQLFMLVLCIFALGQLGVQAAFPLKPSTRAIIEYADIVVCIIFFIDFLITLARSPDRFRYFRTWGWIDLLSSVPTIDIARWGRFARVLRIFRVLRGLRAARSLSVLILKHRAENTLGHPRRVAPWTEPDRGGRKTRKPRTRDRSSPCGHRNQVDGSG